MSTPEATNLLMVTTDQQRFDTVRPDAPPFLRTPHLDLLQHEGVNYGRAYAQTPICVPSRVSLMSGRSPFAHGLTSNGSSSDVLDRTSTLPARLRAAGYGTAAVGKMHFTPQRARHGFDEMHLPEDYYRWIRQSGSLQQPMRHGLGQNELYPAHSTVPEALTLTSWTAEQCVEFIRERRDPTCPFFLWASFSKPHPPLDPPEPYASMYADAAIPPPVRSTWSRSPTAPAAFRRQRERGAFDLLPDGVVEAARAAYYGLVTHVDYALGRILAALQDVGLLETTTIVFTSDHGEFLGDHGTGNKVLFHEPSARIPLVVRPAPVLGLDLFGTSCDALVTHTDVTATFLELAGAGAAGGTDDTDGTDLLAVAAGNAEPRHHLCGVASERTRAGTPGPPLYLAVTDGRWKYLWYPEGPAQQLFDLHTDPHERNDLAGDPTAGEVAGRLRGLLTDHVAQERPGWLVDGALPATPAGPDSTRHWRASAWPGFHTEFHPVDVRH